MVDCSIMPNITSGNTHAGASPSLTRSKSAAELHTKVPTASQLNQEALSAWLQLHRFPGDDRGKGLPDAALRAPRQRLCWSETQLDSVKAGVPSEVASTEGLSVVLYVLL